MKPTPINNHVLIQPITHDSFISTQKDTYEEIGIIEAVAEGIHLTVGTKVWFDSWLCAKYPLDGENNSHFFLVPYESIRAIYAPLPE